MVFKINGIDFTHLVSSLKVGYETLVSSDSGRNAAGDTVIDIINRKRKLYITFRYMTQDEMASLLDAIKAYVVNVEYIDPKTKQAGSARVYTGTPEPEYFTIQPGKVIFKSMDLNFIEL